MVRAKPYGPNQTRMEAVRNRQGGSKKIKIRCVCGACNSGWMNQIEEAVRPDLTAMIQGNPVQLDRGRQRKLAEWITLKLMVAEHEHPSGVVFPSEVNRAFYERRELPSRLSIWLFKSEPYVLKSFYHFHGFWMSTRPVYPAANGPRKNVKTVTFGIGDLFVFALYINSPEIQLNFNPVPGISVGLLPEPPGDLHWPPSLMVNMATGTNIAQSLMRISNDAKTRWLP